MNRPLQVKPADNENRGGKKKHPGVDPEFEFQMRKCNSVGLAANSGGREWKVGTWKEDNPGIFLNIDQQQQRSRWAESRDDFSSSQANV